MSSESLETRWARQDAGKAARELRHHIATCSACWATGSCRFCPAGAELAAAKERLNSEAAESARLDAAPSPGQVALW